MDEEDFAQLKAYEEEVSNWDKDHLLTEKMVAENRLSRLSELGYEVINDDWAIQKKLDVSQKNLKIAEEKTDCALYSAAISNVLERQHRENKIFTRTQAYLITCSTVVLAISAVATLVAQLLKYLEL